MMRFDEDYYERGEETGRSCYTDYKWMPELTMPLVHEIVMAMDILYGDRILDFGCAKGFMVRAFREMGYMGTRGVDVSAYAINSTDYPYIHQADHNAIAGLWDVVIAKDVLEHLVEADVPNALWNLSGVLAPGGKILVVVPLGNGVEYDIPEMELDDTHVVRQPIEWWEAAVAKNLVVEWSGYRMGAMMKRRWRDKYPDGHGIIIGRKVL